LRLYLDRVDPADFASLTLVAAGAEYLPMDLIDDFEARFDVRPISGYGVTEASPAIAANIPPSRWASPDANLYREGTVGKPLPGIETRVVDRETGAEVGLTSEGILWVTGPNIMLGYVNDSEQIAEALHDGWYNTQDVVVLDEDGFITITGRESQFSKIAGESVPHLLIEERINQILASLDGNEPASAAVTSVPHATRGERVVVVHTPMPIDPGVLRQRLRELGLPPLFIPAKESFVEVEELPLLGSGKTDLRRLKLVALDAFDEHGNRRGAHPNPFPAMAHSGDPVAS
jgi:acyl-[acyl-carrier-protein]-phospholipid O-acyltransferase / long-chain-fatty-acid--[acyl-carrier-protein] ligase